MGMVVIGGSRCVTRTVGTSWQIVVGVVVTVIVAVVPKMCSVARSVFQRIANTQRRSVSGVQREYGGKKKREASAHDAGEYS